MFEKTYKPMGFNASEAMCVLEATLELSSERWRATWVQGHLAEALLHRKACEFVNVGFTQNVCNLTQGNLGSEADVFTSPVLQWGRDQGNITFRMRVAQDLLQFTRWLPAC